MFLEPPVTPKHAKMRGDNSPIYPPLTPIPSRWLEAAASSSATSSATGPLGANVVSGLHSSLSRSNSGAVRAPSAAAASATGDKPHIGVDSRCFNSTKPNTTGGGGDRNSSNSSTTAGSCENGQHRERLARLTAKIQRVDQQQLRLTGVSVALAVGLLYLLLERMGLKQLRVSFTFATYIPLLHLLPALCAFCIVWLRLPRSVPQSTTPPAAPTAGAPAARAPAANSHPDGLEEELLQKYVSTRGLVVVRQSEQVHRRFANSVLRFLVCLAFSDFFAAYVQFWPLLHTPAEVRSPVPTAAASAVERPPIFGPSPPGVYREGFERYPPENVPLPQSGSIFNSSSSNTMFACAQRVAAVLTYLLRVLAAVWVLKAAKALAPGAVVAAAREDTNEQHKRQQSKGKHQKWTAYLKSLPGGAYGMQKLCVLGVKEGSLDGLIDYCCSPDAAKQLLFSLLSAFFLLQVWRMPLSAQKPSSPLFAFARTSPQRADSSSYMVVVGLLGVAALQLLVNALLLVVNDICMPLLRKLRPQFLSLSSRFSPPSSSSVAAATSPRRRPPVQQACLSLFVVAVLLEIFSTIVGVRAVFHMFMQCEPQSQVLALAETSSKGERVLICSAAVAHTLAAFVFASAGTCCSLQNYLISKIFRDGKVNEDEVLKGLHASL